MDCLLPCVCTTLALRHYRVKSLNVVKWLMLLKAISKSKCCNLHLLPSLGMGCNSAPTFFSPHIPDENLLPHYLPASLAILMFTVTVPLEVTSTARRSRWTNICCNILWCHQVHWKWSFEEKKWRTEHSFLNQNESKLRNEKLPSEKFATVTYILNWFKWPNLWKCILECLSVIMEN